MSVSSWRRCGAAVLVAAVGLIAAACQTPSVPLPLGVVPAATGLPAGAQDGTLTVPLTCSLPILGNTTFILNMSGVGGTLVGPGQSFYLTAGHGSLTVPASLIALSGIVGTASVQTTLTDVEFNASNATPSSINIAKTPISVSTPIVAGQPTKVRIPSAGDLTIGPFTAGPSGVVQMTMGASTATITLLNASGGTILVPLTVTCAAPTPPVVLVGLTIGGPSGQPVQRYDGLTVGDATLPAGFVEGSLALPLTCSVTGIGSVPIVGELTGSLPAYLPEGNNYYFQDGSGILEFPASVVTSIVATTGASRISGSITTLNFTATGSTPASLNGAATPIPVAPVPLTAGQGLNIGIPQSGVLTIGPFTPIAGAPLSTLVLGTSGGTLQPEDASGNAIGSPLAVSCGAPDPATILLQEPNTTGTVPTVGVIAPLTGPAAGGTSVTLTGTGFTGALAVNFGNTYAASFTVNSDTSITVTTPPHPAGEVDVTVLGPQGPSPTVTQDYFTYQ
jgi:hypothetical protein